MKGIPTEIVPVSEIGNANDIKTYITNYYKNNGLTFVLLVGDIDQIPTLYSGVYASDPSYTYIVGNDHYPDIFVGRFSAQNSDQVITQVERSIEYERDPQIGAYWYNLGTGIASDSGPGDDGELDYEHMDKIRDKLMNYTYNDVDQIYDPNATTQMVINAINFGRSIINYCGHGTIASWTTSDFTVQDIKNLVNYNKLPYVICVACNNGEFNKVNTSFCEAWLRATNNSEPTGAIAATGSSQKMSWSPTMDAQDEMIDLIVESYENNIKHTIGGIHYNGLMHMNDEYGGNGFLETDTWHVFGDPSIQIRTDTPLSMSVIHENEIMEYATSYQVLVTDVENAMCAISRNGQLLGYAFTDHFGNATINFNETITGDDPLDLVITAFNKVPYIVKIPVILNKPPLKPNKPAGLTKGITNTSLTFSTNTSDQEGNQVFYMWDWGDGNQSIWMGPYESDEIVNASWIWTEEKIYEIKVKAKDSRDYESEWSDSLNISIPRLKNINNKLFLGLLDHFLNIILILKKIALKF
jgi:hypothetical protein